MKKGKILVLDDDNIVTMACKRILGAEGYEVNITAKGEDALNQLAKHDDYDLLITDIKMPEISGMIVLKETKLIRPDTEVVMITGYPNPDDAKESIELGAYEYVEKPFTPDFMIKIADKVFDKQGWILRKGYIDKFKNYIVPIRGKNPYIYYKEMIWARPLDEGIWEIGCDLRDEMASGEMMYVDYIRNLDILKAGDLFARLYSGSGKTIELQSPMDAKIKEINNMVNDVISSFQGDYISEGWLLWLVRVLPFKEF